MGTGDGTKEELAHLYPGLKPDDGNADAGKGTVGEMDMERVFGAVRDPEIGVWITETLDGTVDVDTIANSDGVVVALGDIPRPGMCTG